jgi:glycosyltransferase involved in cell wall biosynthesis
MKIFILAAQENWITDQLAQEWIEHNKDLYTHNLQEADIIWILSNYVADVIPIEIYKQKKVITTIHHIVPWKMDVERKHHFKYLDYITDYYHSICDKTTVELKKYTDKKIITNPFWNNPKIYYPINNKNNLRVELNIPIDCYLIGSFQRDTEGNSINNKTYLPKLEKGPDIFMEIIKKKKETIKNIKILLTGRCRQYLMKKLNEINVEYIYYEMTDFNTLNKLYNCLDLYIVSSRVEGGPRAINECALAKVPVISSDVGIAQTILSKESIFDMNNLDTILTCKSNIEYAFNNVKNLNIPEYFYNFNQLFFI